MNIKRFLSFFLVSLMLLSALASCANEKPQTGEETTGGDVTPVPVDSIYVDANAESSGDGSESSPYKTIAEAQEKIREMKAANTLPDGGISVVLASGDYPPIKLTELDSGSEDCPITYVSAEDRGARITGGIALNYSDFEAISDDEASRLYDKSAAEHILKVDLKKYGLTADDWGAECLQTGNEVEAELYINAKRMTVAKYPNEGFFFVGENIVGDIEKEDGKKSIAFNPGDETKQHMASWKNIEQAWIDGYFACEWTYSMSKFDIDENDGSVIVNDFSSDNMFVSSRYEFKNIYEEMDMAGEYYVDRENGILYLYATEELEKSDIRFAISKEAIAELNGVSYVNFKGITFAETRSIGIKLEGDNVTFDNIFLYGTGAQGVSILSYTGNTYLSNITIQNSEITHTGASAILCAGGDATNLVKANTLIYNNYIHDFADLQRTYSGAVRVVGTGITISHNEICNTAHTAILHDGGPYVKIEYNDIYNVCNESSDCGAIYSGRRGIRYGTEINYNHIHDIGTKDIYDYKSDYFRAAAIYMDDGLPGVSIVGNLIENTTGRGIYMGGGRDCVVKNNIMIATDRFAIEYDSRMHDSVFTEYGWFSTANIDRMQEELKTILDTNDVWEEAFPILATINFNYAEATDIFDPTLFINPVNIIVSNNIHSDGGDKRVYVDAIEQGGLKQYNTNENNWKIKLTDFVDYENGDYRLRTDAAVYKRLPGWEDIPLEEMGRVA